MLTLSIPARRDPIARGVLLALIAGVAWLAIARPGVEPAQAQSEIILIATPTLPMPTEQPAVAQAAPTPVPGFVPAPVPTVDYNWIPSPVPVIVQQEPEVIYQTAEPIIVTTVPEVIVNTPVITYQTAVPETRQQLPSGAAIIIATPGPNDPGFADSFGAPDPKAKCQFVGCL